MDATLVNSPPVDTLKSLHFKQSHELAALFREISEVQAAIITQRADAWLEGSHLNSTDRRESARAKISPLEAEETKLKGEIQAIQAMLASYEFQRNER